MGVRQGAVSVSAELLQLVKHASQLLVFSLQQLHLLPKLCLRLLLLLRQANQLLLQLIDLLLALLLRLQQGLAALVLLLQASGQFGRLGSG